MAFAIKSPLPVWTAQIEAADPILPSAGASVALFKRDGQGMALLVPTRIIVFVQLQDCLWPAFGNTQGGAGLSCEVHRSSVSVLSLWEIQVKGLTHVCAQAAQHGDAGAYWVERFICSFGYIPRYNVSLALAEKGSDHYQLSGH